MRWRIAILALMIPFRAAWAADDSDDFWGDWAARAKAALESQPHWIPSLMTVSPRLTQVIRYDQYWEDTNARTALNSFDSGKGIEIIPFETTSFTFNLPPYDERSRSAPASGWGDWPIVLVKQRLASAPEESGDYIVTAYFSATAPIGSAAFTNHAWVLSPGLGFGKGWGDLNVEGSVIASIPTTRGHLIGTAIATNAMLQYHWSRYVWPEVELNDTTWSGGPRDGRNQLFMTMGAVFGNVPVFENYALGIGAGYQFALTAHDLGAPALVPVYDHNWILSARVVY